MFGNSRNASAAAMPVDIALNTSSVSSRAGEAWNSMVREVSVSVMVGRPVPARNGIAGLWSKAASNCYSAGNETSHRQRAAASGRTPPC